MYILLLYVYMYIYYCIVTHILDQMLDITHVSILLTLLYASGSRLESRPLHDRI